MEKDLTDKDKIKSILGLHNGPGIEEFNAWTENDAVKLARTEGIELTDKHFEVIRFMRVHFENVGAEMPKAHEFMSTLKEQFSEEGGLKYLYLLFPGGPLSQGFRFAGIPVPKDAKNMSFGTVF